MQFSLEMQGQALIATLQGELDLHTAPEFKEELTVAFETHPQIRHLILDLKDITFIDSSGLGVILGRYRELQARNGKLFFVRTNPQVKRILQFSGFQKISEFADSTREVVARL